MGFLLSPEACTVEQELDSIYGDNVHEIMNCPIPEVERFQTLGDEYDVVFLPNCQQLQHPSDSTVDDEPDFKRSSTNSKIKAGYGTAVL
jgi:hypothetical protein